MTIVSSKLPLHNKGRKKIQAAGLRPSAVFVDVVQWSSGERNLGTPTLTRVELTPRPEVIQKDDHLLISGVTPAHNGGGWLPVQLQPLVVAGADYYITVVGPDGAEKPYDVREINLRSAFTYELTLKAHDRAKPDYDE